MVTSSNIINLDISINNLNRGISNQIDFINPSINTPKFTSIPTPLPTVDVPSIIYSVNRPILQLKGLYIRIFRYRR